MKTRSWRCPAHTFDRVKRALAERLEVIDSGSSGVLRPRLSDPAVTGRFTYDGEMLTIALSFQDPLASEIWRLIDDLCGPPIGLG